jgi:glycine/serine hydroxymethyltransferase
MKEPEMKQIGEWIIEALKHHDNTEKLHSIKSQVKDLAQGFPVPGIE